MKQIIGITSGIIGKYKGKSDHDERMTEHTSTVNKLEGGL